MFNYSNFGLTTESSPRWYKTLNRHLTALKLIQFITNRIDPKDIKIRKKLKLEMIMQFKLLLKIV